MSTSNQTKQDANDRVTEALVGSLANSSIEYCEQLRKRLYEWTETVTVEIHQKYEQMERESYETEI